MKNKPTIERLQKGHYIVRNIETNTTYTITHLEDKEPKIEINEK